MATIELVLTSYEVHTEIPYAVICMTRYGSDWNTMRRKRRWKEEFTEQERGAAEKLFPKAHNWLLGRGVPETVRMPIDDFALWQKLGDFCASI